MKEAQQKPIAWLRSFEHQLSKFVRCKSSVHCDEKVILGLPTYWFTPKQPNSNKAIIYFHGGGFVLPSTRIYKNYCNLIAQNSDTTVILIQYRLAPEYQFPTAHEDTLTITKEIIQTSRFTEFQLIGDSAGASLLLFTFKQLELQNLARNISSIALISPWASPTQTDSSMFCNQKSDYLSRAILKRWLAAYCPPNEQYKLTSLLADFPFGSCPTLFVQFASDEIMAQQIRAFATLALNNNVDITVDETANLYHNFQIIGMNTPEGYLANKNLVQFLNKHL